MKTQGKNQFTAMLMSNFSAEDGNMTTELVTLIAAMIALYTKTKYFHWWSRDTNFPGCRLLLDEQAEEIFEMTGLLARQAAKRNDRLRTGENATLGGVPGRSMSAALASALGELSRDNERLAARIGKARSLCDDLDAETVPLLGVCKEKTAARAAFLLDAVRTIELGAKL